MTAKSDGEFRAGKTEATVDGIAKTLDEIKGDVRAMVISASKCREHQAELHANKEVRLQSLENDKKNRFAWWHSIVAAVVGAAAALLTKIFGES